ncbi:MAG: hypothetical protein K2W96_24445 [Gemmataceae bacterium]|nr:hypothetical protein [Gemmataceae bacterium]
MRTMQMLGVLLASSGWAGAAPARGEKPIRVLLLGSGTMTRESQFLGAILARAMESKKAEVSVHLQPADKDAKPPVLPSLPPERVLRKFPADLGKYDAVVAFDLDWERLGKKQADALRKWTKAGGGLVVVGGPVSTASLAKEESEAARALLPVVMNGKEAVFSDKPRKLTLAAEAEKGVLKLDWKGFFGDAKAPRGFYGYQPVKAVKKEAKVLASLADPKAKLASGDEQPFIVEMPLDGGRVVYLASGELWRVREYREAAHDRLWNQLLAHAAGKAAK